MAEPHSTEREPVPGTNGPAAGWPAARGHDGAERRAFDRFALPEPLDARLRGRIVVRVLDLSRGGALLETETPLRPLAATDLSIAFEDEAFVARAVVLRCTARGLAAGAGNGRALVYRAAIEFEELSRRDGDLLEGNLGFLRFAAAAPGPAGTHAGPDPERTLAERRLARTGGPVRIHAAARRSAAARLVARSPR